MKPSLKLASLPVLATAPSLALLLLPAQGAHADTSAADLSPPPIAILTSSPRVADGFVFVAPKTTGTLSQGPEIIDNQGRPVWYEPLAAGHQASDFHVQNYRGAPVLTWSESEGLGGLATIPTVDYVLDRSYKVIAAVRAGNGYNADPHEFRLTPYGTALITIYDPVPFDLSPYGGPKDGVVVDGIAQELDIATGRVLFEWHSLDHVGIDESQVAVPTVATATTPYDYFHINAVNLDTDGQILISSRHTWTVFKIDHRSGEVIWRLGGKKTSFALGDGVQFAWQHDPEPAGPDTLRIFDNEAAPAVRAESRVIWVRYDTARKTATLVRAFEHPDKLQTGSQGNSQALDNGDTFVGWGQLGRVSEFDREGNLLFDAQVPAGYDDYRAYRQDWQGHPTSGPSATLVPGGGETARVHAVWNGATDVARWIVLGGPGPQALRPIGAAAWKGLDTAIPIAGSPAYVAVVALNAFGLPVGQSAPTASSN
jgi:hypothetical protein